MRPRTNACNAPSTEVLEAPRHARPDALSIKPARSHAALAAARGRQRRPAQRRTPCLPPRGARDASIAYRHDVDEVVAEFGTDANRGLDDDDVRTRRERHGPTELTVEKPAPAWRRFLAQFQDALVILLLAATAISAALWAVERDAALPYEAIRLTSRKW